MDCTREGDSKNLEHGLGCDYTKRKLQRPKSLLDNLKENKNKNSIKLLKRKYIGVFRYLNNTLLRIEYRDLELRLL